MYFFWSASLNPAWPSDQHVGLSAILGSRPSSRDFFLEILSLLPRDWEEDERMEGGGGEGAACPNGQHVALAIHGRSRPLAPLRQQARFVCFVVPN